MTRAVLVMIVSFGGGCLGFERPPDVGGYRDAVLDDDPLAYWRLDDDGPIAHSEIPGSDGEYAGAGCMRVTGALVGDPDRAVRFDGNDCKVDVGDGFEFATNAPFSLELWYAADPGGEAFQELFSRQTRNSDPSDPIDGYALVRGNDDPMGVYFERVVGTEVLATQPYSGPSGAFVHVVAVYDGAESVLYIDGAPFGRFPDGRPMGTVDAKAFIGAVADPAGDYNHFLGVIDEVAVYGGQLPADRIQAHYEIGVMGPG